MRQSPEIVAVVGSGLMGHGIAQAFASAGHPVVLIGRDEGRLTAALRRIEANLAEMGGDPAPVLARVSVATDLPAGLADARFVIESISEKLQPKQELFARIAEAAPGDAVLASNTSALPIGRIGADLPPAARARLLGTHWWNPPHLIPLVEVTPTECTAPEAFDFAFGLLTGIGKKPVRVSRDIPGFVGNRLQHALWREALSLIDSGVCDAETIDLVVKNSFGLRMPVLGPMEQADMIGLEVSRDSLATSFPDLSCDTHPHLLSRLIDEGKLGMATGEGLRPWTPEQGAAVRRRLSQYLIEVARNDTT